MKSKHAVLIGLMASLSGLAGAAASTDRPSPTDPRGWRAVLGSEARQSHVLRPGVELFFTGENERVVAVLRVAGAAANEGVTFTVPGASGYTKSYNGHVRLTLPEGDLAFVRPGAVQDDGTGLKPVFSEWAQAGPAGVKLVFPGHEGKLPLLVRFEVIFLADPKARELYDRNGDGRIDLLELTPPAGPQADAPEGGPVVSASLVDAFVVDNGTAGQANPGDVIGYTATIGSTGTTATALAYNNPIDPDTTLVGGSVNVSPLALNDSYNAVGNVTLDVDTAPAGIFGNDREFPFGLTTFTLATAGPNAGTQAPCGSFPCIVPTSGGGTVVLKSPGDGRFTYTSPAGVSTGTDTFVYVITDGAMTDSATVTFNIAGRVWFVKADAPGGGTGTQALPFNVLSPTTVAGVGGAGDVDGPNDYIYLYETAAATDYPAGIELEPTQHLVGSGVALVVGATTVLPAGTPPTLSNASGDGVTLSTDSDVRGLTIAAANNSGISGSGSLGTLGTIDSSVSIVTSGTGTGATFANVASPNTLAFAASITGTGAGPAVSVTGQNGTLNLASANVAKTGGRLVQVANKTGGTVTFGSPSLSGGTGGDAVVIQNNTGGSVTAFGTVIVNTSGGRALFANNGGTIDLPPVAHSLIATGFPALDVTGTAFSGTGGTAFATVSSTNSATTGVNLVNVSGNTLQMNAGAISGSTGTAFNVSQGSSGINYAGTISKTNAGRAVDVQTRGGGTVQFGGAITATGASTGINVSGATAASTVSFAGAVDLGTSGTRLTGGTALTVNHAGNASVTSFSDLDVFTTGQAGIDASNGGTFNVTTGQIDAGGRALNLDGLAAGATFTSVVSAGSSSQGVRLNAVTGTLTHTSTTITGAGQQGISVAASSANITFAIGGNPTSVSGSTTQGILVGTSTGTIAFGNTIVSGGTDAVSLQNNSSGSRTFGTLMTSANTGVGFLHAGGGGATSASGLVVITNPGGTGVDISGNTTAITFTGTTVNKGASAGTGVSLASNGTSPSFGTLTVTTSNGTGVLIGGTGSGLTTSGGSISATSGPAINSTNGAFAATFATVTSTNSGTQGITLTGSSGTLTMNGGTISGSAGTAFNIGGGNAGVTYAGTVTVTNGQSGLATSNVTGGSLSINTVNVSGTGAGRDAVVIDGNGAAYDVTITSATLNTSAMRHGVALSDLGAGSDITFSGGTITSTGAGRRVVNFAGPTNGIYTFGNVTLVATTSDGLNFGATQLGTYGFRDLDCASPNGGVCVTGTGNSAAITFRAVSQNGGTTGVSLSNTTGSFTVTGTGAANSGGTIQNVSVDGILLASAQNLSFTDIRILNTIFSGIRGTGVVNFTLANSTIDANGHFPDVTNSFPDDSNIRFDTIVAGTESNVSGVVSITGNTLTNATWHGIDIQNASGTISTLTITNNTLTSGTTTGGGGTSKGSAIRVLPIGSAGGAASVTRATITGNIISNFPGGAGIMVQGGNSNAAGPAGTLGIPNSGTDIITITGNRVAGNGPANKLGTQAIIAAVSAGNGGARSRGNFNMSTNGTVANPLTNITGIVVGIGNNGHADTTATINSNVMVANNTVGSGGVSGGNGVVLGLESPDLLVTANSNSISQIDGNGILLVGRGTVGAARFKIQNNTVAAPLGGVRPGIRVDAGNNAAGSDDEICLNKGGNTSAGSGGSQGLGLRKQGTVTTTHDFAVHNMVATASPAVEAHIDGQNPGGGGTLLISATSGFSNCSLP